jgi:DNA-binding protein Fis
MKSFPFSREEIEKEAIKNNPIFLEGIDSQSQSRTEKQDIYEPIRQFVIHHLQNGSKEKLFDQVIETIERTLLVEVLTLVKNNRSDAAFILGLSKPKLQAKIIKYGLFSLYCPVNREARIESY